MRLQFPPGTSPEEERLAAAAIELYFRLSGSRPSPWSLSGRTENLRLGALQVRHQSRTPWSRPGWYPFTRRGARQGGGRGDTK